MEDMKPFGTIESRFCCNCCELVQDEDGNNVHDGVRQHILGGDDEWYCSFCEPTEFAAADGYYNGQPWQLLQEEIEQEYCKTCNVLLRRHVGPEGDDVTYRCPVCKV